MLTGKKSIVRKEQKRNKKNRETVDHTERNVKRLRSIGGRAGGGDRGGSCPICRQGGQTESNAPHFADLVE